MTGDAYRPGLVGAEVWRPIASVPEYEVSNLGSVRSLKRGAIHVMVPVPDTDGYLTVKLYLRGRGGVRFKVHRLVCEAFHGPAPAGHEAAHLDGTKTNASADNLQWCTPAENQAHKLRHGTNRSGHNSTRAMMPEQTVRQILEMTSQGLSQRKIAGALGIEKTAVHRVQHGETRAARRFAENGNV